MLKKFIVSGKNVGKHFLGFVDTLGGFKVVYSTSDQDENIAINEARFIEGRDDPFRFEKMFKTEKG